MAGLAHVVLFLVVLLLALTATIIADHECNNAEIRYKQGDNVDEKAARAYLDEYNVKAEIECNTVVTADWNYASNLTEENKRIMLEAKLGHAKFSKEAWKNSTSFAWKNFTDPQVVRQFKQLSVLGVAALDHAKLTQYEQLNAEMESIYSRAKICEYKPPSAPANASINCDLSLEPDLTRIMAKSSNYDELVHVWKAWRDASGKLIRQKYIEFNELGNEAARLNGFPSRADLWLLGYEDDHIEQEMERMWEQVRPLYQHLHAYVRRKLMQKYGADKIRADGPIPAHILGNMWAQSWISLYNSTAPFPAKPTIDVTDMMVEQKYTPLRMFKMSEEFFTSLGLEPMPESFWNKSIIEKPTNREIVCHASAWDFCNRKDVRIKQCTDVTMAFLETTHHEMGHIQYFLQYKDQPISFREGANPGFHEAVGDLMSLSVITPKHLKQTQLLKDDSPDKEMDINFLFSQALKKVAFLPFGYLIDKWRWGLFRGEIKNDELNKQWWEHRLRYQGLMPPVPRTEEDFDAGAKYHIPASVEYSRYYIAAILQFHFQKALCEIAGHKGPLYQCDIYKSKDAGTILRNALKMGSSRPWPEVLRILTGRSYMDAGPLMEYFQPLYEWLKDQNKLEYIGWKA